jgi:hypothetical protein
VIESAEGTIEPSPALQCRGPASTNEVSLSRSGDEGANTSNLDRLETGNEFVLRPPDVETGCITPAGAAPATAVLT